MARPYPLALSIQTIEFPGDGLDRLSFDFFRSQTVVAISGYFDCPLWGSLVLQASHSEPAVRYAAVALGALHQEITLQHSTVPQHQTLIQTGAKYPLSQYTKAMKNIR